MDRSPHAVWLLVAGGSAAGGLLRHFLTEAFGRADSGLPWATVWINVGGSLAIGLVFGLASELSSETWSAVTRHGIMTGMLGGFTTFSAFSLQTVTLVQQGLWAAALANVMVSVVIGLASCWAGLALAAGTH